MVGAALTLCLGLSQCDSDATTWPPAACERGEEPFEIVGTEVVGDVLRLDVTYVGGCGDHLFQVWWGGAVATSQPPQVPLEMHHFSRGERCSDVVHDEIYLDASVLEAEIGGPSVYLDFIGSWWAPGLPSHLTSRVLYEYPTSTGTGNPAGTITIETTCGGISG